MEIKGPADWSDEEYAKFIDLDRRLVVPDSPNALYNALKPAPKEADVSAAWKARRASPIFIWLEAQESYQDHLWPGFERAAKKAKPNGKIRQSTAPFAFHRIVVRGCMRGFQIGELIRIWGEKSIPYGPTSERREMAIGHASKLIGLISHGVWPSKGSTTDLAQMQYQLMKFVQAMKLTVRMKKRDGLSIRKVVCDFSYDLHAEFGIESPAMIRDFSPLVGFRCDDKMAQRIQNEVRERRSLEVEDRLTATYLGR